MVNGDVFDVRVVSRRGRKPRSCCFGFLVSVLSEFVTVVLLEVAGVGALGDWTGERDCMIGLWIRFLRVCLVERRERRE